LLGLPCGVDAGLIKLWRDAGVVGRDVVDEMPAMPGLGPDSVVTGGLLAVGEKRLVMKLAIVVVEVLLLLLLLLLDWVAR
jgi:hypothetical protein